MRIFLLNHFSQVDHRFKDCGWEILLMYCIYISSIKIIIHLWYHIDLSHLSELHNFTGWFSPILFVFICIMSFWWCANLYKWVFKFKLFFLKGTQSCCLIYLYQVKTYEISKNTHGVSLIVVSTWAFFAIILQFFNICDNLWHVNSVVQLPR